MYKRQLISQKLALPDATALRQMIAAGEISPVQIVKEYAERIGIFHSQLNAAVKVFKEKALEEAANPLPGPLSGIPISVKETFGIAGEIVTSGSKRGVHTLCAEDSTIVARLKAAGAIILARSNTPEFAMFPETDNLLIGRTNNPLNLDRTPGGSSGGEGALVGSGCSVLGVCSDIGGSIRYPAAFCGVVGFKPASEAVDKHGTFPQVNHFADSLLALGPITRSVRDAKLVYNIIANKPIPDTPPKDLKDLRLFYPQVYKEKLRDPEVSGAVGMAQALLLEAGMQKTHSDFSEASQLYLDFNQLIVNAFEGSMNESLMGGVAGSKISMIQESFNQIMGKPTIHHWLYQMFVAFPLFRPSNKKLKAIIARTEEARSKYYTLLGEDGILVLPTVGVLAPKHGAMVAELRKPGVVEPMKPTVFCNMLNLPAITLPAWKHRSPASGLVPGVMLVCRPGSEGILFQVAEWLEGRI